MTKRILSITLGLFLVPVVRAADLSNGFYEITYNNPRMSIAVESGNIVGVGHEKQFDIQSASLTSGNNWNESFYLRVDVPYDKSLEKVPWHILVVNGKAYKQDSLGSMGKKSSLWFGSIPGEQKEDVANFFSIQPDLRKHPGHQLAARFIPQKGEFLPDENVIVTLRIKNVGTNTIAFEKGGRNRAARDNQYVFSARYDGKQVEDIGSSYHFGGLGFRRVLKPGDTFEDKISLKKWFSFTQPGLYEIHGSYYLEFKDPVNNAQLQAIWEDYISADITIRIKKTSKPSTEGIGSQVRRSSALMCDKTRDDRIQWLFFTWGLYLVPATILGTPVWFFGRRRVKWMWIDFMVLILPYGICTVIPPGLNNITMLYTALYSGIVATIAPLTRVIVRDRINEYRSSIYSVLLVCGITLIICMLGPGFIHAK